MDITGTGRKKRESKTKKMFLRRRKAPVEDRNNKCFKKQTHCRTNMSLSKTTNTTSRAQTALSWSAFLVTVLQLSLLMLVRMPPPVASASAEYSQLQYQEILVQPSSAVRIECKLPESGQVDLQHWNFQQELPDAPPKSYVLAFESKHVPDPTLNHQLEMEPQAGVYDLLISNVTTNNNGLYKCDYKIDNGQGKQSIQKEIRLTVLIPPQPPVIQAAIMQAGSPAPAREGLEYQLSCLSQGGNPEPNITWYRNEQLLSSSSPGTKIEQTRSNGTTNSTLTLVPTMEDHQASYKCSVWNKAMSGQQAHEKEVRLQVEYAPRINVGQFDPLRVLIGTQITLHCQVDANPPVKEIRWYRNGRFMSNLFNHSINEVKISDSGAYLCQADNGIAPSPFSSPINSHGKVVGPASSYQSLFNMANSEHQSKPTAVEAQFNLQVLYPPRVQVTPSRQMPLNEGDNFSLNCSVDSYPPPHEYIWTKLDDLNFRRVISAAQGSYLEFPSTTASDMGNYTCTATNRMEASALGYQQQVVERQSSGSAIVQVNHKPGLAELSVGQSGRAELGQKTQLQCKARPPGYPEPRYTFWKVQNGQRLHMKGRVGPSDTYNILAARAEDEGRYGCSVTNGLGTSTEAEAELTVNEAPTIIRDTSTRPGEDNKTVGDHPYSITVRASGRPKPEVTWFHRSPVDGRRFELGSSEWQSKFKIETLSAPEPLANGAVKYNVVSTLIFKQPLELDDRGLYTVEFNNGLSRSASEDIPLHIHHSPIPAPANQPIVANLGDRPSRVKAGFNQGETVNLTCRVSAHPRPVFVWFSKATSQSDKPIENNSRYSITLSNPRDDIWESTLSFPLANKEDYGEYLCSVANIDFQTNRLGESVRIFIDLSQKTIPDAPSQLQAIDASQDSITLQWVPGFDGGYAQTQYLVQYVADDGSGQSLSKRFPGYDLRQVGSYAGGSVLDSMDLVSAQQAALQMGSQATNRAYPKLFDCLSMNPCTISQLLPRQTYLFRLYAKNEAGPSEYSAELRATTRANLSQIPKILNPSFDSTNNVLHFRIESGTDYLLSSLNARIETRPLPGAQVTGTEDNSLQLVDEMGPSSSGWRLIATVPILQETAEAHLAIQQDSVLRLTLCSRANESLCGPEHEISTRSAASSFYEGQQGLSVYIFMFTVTLIVLIAALATAVHSCCLSKKAKKADSIERVEGSIDNKPIANGQLNGGHSLPGAVHKSSHGSTTSTNSTSANGASTNGLQSMDSINGVLGANGTTSDHSSDHSRQAKLDSMLPPNYNHYADRASILMEQQQQQQQQMMMQQHQVGLMGTSDKLSSQFGLPNSALLGVASQQQRPSPGTVNTLMDGTGGLNYFTYQSQLEAQQHPSLDNGMMLGAAALEAAADAASHQQQQQQALWPNQLDDYNTYNALGYANAHQAQEQMLDPAYGTTGAVMMSQHSAAYDNSANSGQFQSYLNAYQSSQVADTPTNAAQYQQQRAQYQAELAVAQQQMYGTLTRSGYSNAAANGNNNIGNNDHVNKSIQNASSSQQLMDQHQQQYSTTANGLNPTPQLTPLGQQQQPPPQESDYGTIGGRSGRLIREIIV